MRGDAQCAGAGAEPAAHQPEGNRPGEPAASRFAAADPGFLEVTVMMAVLVLLLVIVRLEGNLLVQAEV